jgi:CheY-like chemotaxis protein
MDHSRVPNVLVVDDECQIRDLFGRVLSRSGMAVRFAEDGVGGLAEARARVPDVIVSDLGMPRMDGLALCRALRRDPATQTVPILVVSGSDAGQMRAALDAGCDAVLVKPCTGAMLVHTINRLLLLRSDTLPTFHPTPAR